MKRSQEYYDDFSRSYEKQRSEGYHFLIDELEVEIAATYLDGARVLEIGCGTGLILERLRKRAAFACGFDLSPKMVQKARDRGLNVVLGNVLNIPFADNCFDLVCSYKVLAHVPEIGRAITEIARVTKPGGRMVLEFYNPYSLRYLAKRIAGPRPIGEGRTEAEVYTRWDAPQVIPRLLPPAIEVEAFYGVRVITPFAAVFEIPFLARALSAIERKAVASPLRYFGGFLVTVLKKRT
ncbi:MAG: class I SAM-dependent methyltransferase [Deltaproteobacteria bacterium]|nr:class I SAM-dependent methyltransferase [Deltaproteobacteria bacterium]